ncbi:CehA/McbA family metallohydrolase [Nonomuraea sp. NPDC046570]|uniref:CehA/McbA family metallohydrolase n=1 Tax=Nonomuraea sp. NPDC046570 TaxID=3155255 RepID=UPI0033C2A650
MTVIHGRWTLDDRLELMLREVPFEVPAGTAAVTVRLRYDRSQGVLDLGCASPDGFRGWSGGARDEYTVSAAWATPGYLPGEPEPGTWQVWLRLHRVPPQGLDYTLEIVAERSVPERLETAEPPSGERPPRRDLPGVDGLRWLAGDFHAHTVHSDGSHTIAELAELAKGRGLDFLAVTDHNTVSHHPFLDAIGRERGIALLPGQEVTTDRGHANVFGEVGWVDFRRPADEWMAHADREGGLISINHPLAADCAWLQPSRERPRVVEVWHSSWWDRRWGAPIAWAQSWRDDVVAIGGSDFHRPGADALPGSPTTWVLAEGPETVVEGVRAGRTAVSAGRDGALLLRLGDELLAVDADGLVLVRPGGERQVMRGDRVIVPANAGPYRLETWDNEVIALCA